MSTSPNLNHIRCANAKEVTAGVLSRGEEPSRHPLLLFPDLGAFQMKEHIP